MLLLITPETAIIDERVAGQHLHLDRENVFVKFVQEVHLGEGRIACAHIIVRARRVDAGQQLRYDRPDERTRQARADRVARSGMEPLLQHKIAGVEGKIPLLPAEPVAPADVAKQGDRELVLTDVVQQRRQLVRRPHLPDARVLELVCSGPELQLLLKRQTAALSSDKRTAKHDQREGGGALHFFLDAVVGRKVQLQSATVFKRSLRVTAIKPQPLLRLLLCFVDPCHVRGIGRCDFGRIQIHVLQIQLLHLRFSFLQRSFHFDDIIQHLQATFIKMLE